MPRRSNIRAPLQLGKLNNLRRRIERRGDGSRNIWAERISVQVIKTKNEDKNIDVSSTLFKTVLVFDCLLSLPAFSYCYFGLWNRLRNSCIYHPKLCQLCQRECGALRGRAPRPFIHRLQVGQETGSTNRKGNGRHHSYGKRVQLIHLILVSFLARRGEMLCRHRPTASAPDTTGTHFQARWQWGGNLVFRCILS